MGKPRSCGKCGCRCFQRDDLSSFISCSSCGIVLEIDEFVAPIQGGVDDTNGNLIIVGTSGLGSALSYRDKKIFDSKKEMDDIITRLGFSASISSEIAAMADEITEGEYGRGAWFPILVGACAHVVLRKNMKPFSMAELAAVLDCDVHELGRMSERLIRHLGLNLPEFDIVGFFKKAIQNCPSFNEICNDKLQIMLKQGVFLLQCCMKWFLTTGRRPMPMIVAVLVFVAEINHVKVEMEDVAMENHAKVYTSRIRYNELLETLVSVAKVLPWGGEITVKNIVKNAPFVMKYLEMKSRAKQKTKNGDILTGFSMDYVIRNCGCKEFEYNADQNQSEMSSDCVERDDSDMILSAEANEVGEFNNPNEEIHTSTTSDPERTNRKTISSLDEKWDDFSNLAEESKNVENAIQNEVGIDALPRSFVKGRIAEGRRRIKIKKAKERIGKIMSGSSSQASDINRQIDDCCNETGVLEKKKVKRKKRESEGFDWEDNIIETLLLHQVEEEEISKGSYKALLGLHVFNSGGRGGAALDHGEVHGGSLAVAVFIWRTGRHAWARLVFSYSPCLLLLEAPLPPPGGGGSGGGGGGEACGI